MSRHDLQPLDPTHDVVVGWDPPLHTFFAQVLDTKVDEADDNYEVVWIGTSYGEVPDPAAVIAAVRPFATIADELCRTLQVDRMTQA